MYKLIIIMLREDCPMAIVFALPVLVAIIVYLCVDTFRELKACANPKSKY